MLLDQLIDCIDSDSKSPESSLDQLEKLFNKMLGNLSAAVEKLAEAFKNIEATIIDEYTAQKNKILHDYQAFKSLPETIETILVGEETKTGLRS